MEAIDGMCCSGAVGGDVGARGCFLVVVGLDGCHSS